MWIRRTAEATALKASKTFSSLLLTGPRQVGKTSLLRRLFSDRDYVTLDVPSLAEQAEKTPEIFLSSFKGPVIIDEVQYAPSLFRHLKVAIDRKGGRGRFLLTGSQNFLVMKGVSESLAGRCAIVQLHSLGAEELKNTLEKERLGDMDLILKGGYPALWAGSLDSQSLWFSSYVATYLERDVRNILNVGKLRDFERFLRAVAVRTGQVLSYSGLARDVGIAVSTAREWVSVLEASSQIFLLEPYYRNMGKRLVKSPKMYMLDTGLACYLLGIETRAQFLRSPMQGALWETFVIGQVVRYMSHRGMKPALWYWRTRDGHEVDLLMEKGGRFYIAEAKFSERPDAGDIRSINLLMEYLGRGNVERAEILCRTAHSYPMGSSIHAIHALKWTL